MVTVYEGVFILAELLILLSMLIVPKLKKQNVMGEQVLKAVCIMTIALAAYSVLTYGQTVIHSDTATATILSESILKHGEFFPKTWNYVNGEIWTLNNGLFTILPTMLIHSQSLARMIGSLSFVLLTLFGIIYQSKKSFKNNSWIISIPIFLIGVRGAEASDMILYQAAYTGHILWITLCSALLYRIYVYSGQEKKWKDLLVYSSLTILLVMGGSRYLAELILPLWCSYIVFIYFKIRENKIDLLYARNKMLYMSAIILIPSILGYGIYSWISGWYSNAYNGQITGLRFVDSIATIGKNLGIYIQNLFVNFGFLGNVKLLSVNGVVNFVSIILCVLICFVVPILQLRKIKQEREVVQLFLTYALIHNVIMFLMSVFLGMMSPRYLLTTIFVWIIVSSRYIYVYWICQKSFERNVWIALYIVAMLLTGVLFVLNSIGWSSMVETKKAFNKTIMSHGLEKGYATYWNAYTNEVYSDGKIKFGGVNITSDSVTPFFWLVDSEVFKPEDKHTFLLLTEAENEILGKNISKIFGNPMDYMLLNENHIYIFDYDIAERFANGLLDGVLYAYELNRNDRGVLEENRLVLKPGGISFGPYEYMEQGDYVVTFYGKGLELSDYDIYTGDSLEKLSYTELSKSDEKIQVQMSLMENMDAMEFRLYNHRDEGLIYLDKITVEEQ